MIVGEEDDSEVNIKTKPFTVDELVVPEEFEELVETTRNRSFAHAALHFSAIHIDLS